MSQVPKRYCVFGCDFLVTFSVPVHRFPNPEKKPDVFNTWLSVVGDKLKETDRMKIYKSKRMCDHHFDPSDKMSADRIKPLARPSVNLHSVRPSLATFVETDHNYSYSVRDTGKPTPESNAGEDEEIHTSGTLPYASSEPEYSQIDDTPGIEDEDPAEKAIFSWQTTELIEADDPEELPPPPSRSADPPLALTCDPDQTVPSKPVLDARVFENRCKDCGEANGGFEFWCVQCSGGAFCGACAARPPHHAHYVLRAPMGSTRSRTQAVLAVIRQQLQNENLLSQHETVDDGVKVEVKEEPADDPHGDSDPLFCGPHVTHEPPGSHELPAPGADKSIAEEVSRHETLELPLLSQATDQAQKIMTVSKQQSILVSPAPDQRVFLIQIEKGVPTHKQKLTGSTKQVRGPLTEAPMKVTSEPQPSETLIIDLDDLADETIEYSEERLDSDIETIEDLLDDEELDDHLVDEDLIKENPSGRGVKRKKVAEETLPTKGPYEEMVRALPSKAVVKVQPLSSLEIRNWTVDRKRLRKHCNKNMI